jgi:serine/threonine protein kinase
LPPDLLILKDVGAALDFIHPRGIVHRDVKPANILIEDGTDRALLADFGVALAAAGADSLTGVGGYVGTPAYSAPEQLASTERVDGRADLFALALVVFEALAGELPAAGLDCAAIAAALHQRCRDVPVALARALVAPLAERPDARPATAAAWLANIGASRRTRWGRPAVAAAGGVLAIAVVAFALGSFQRREVTDRSLAMMPPRCWERAPSSRRRSFLLVSTPRIGASSADRLPKPRPFVDWDSGAGHQ